MSRKSKGARLWLRPSDKKWIIRDGETYVRTGFSENQAENAETALAEYIAEKWQPETDKISHRDINLADVIMIYVEHKIDDAKRPRELNAMAARLNDFWGDMTVSEIIGDNCRRFAKKSTTQSMARHDLEMLRAAVGHYKKEHGLDIVPVFTLPAKGTSRTRWLNRKEAAKLLWETYESGNDHLVRFILIGIYTGTRSGPLLALQWHPNTTDGWIDLEAGVIYREPPNSRQTKKRKPPVAIPNRLMPHLRRWAKKDEGLRHVIHFQGKKIKRINKAFNTAVKEAGLDREVIPHSLRHTAATWMMLKGMDMWDAAKALGMTVQVLEETYGHHHPDYQKALREVF